MIRKLRDIVSIQPGVYVSRDTSKRDKIGFYLGLKDFDEHLNFISKEPDLSFKRANSKYVITEGSLLFSVRLNFKAIRVPKVLYGRAIPSNALVILKNVNELVLIDYLFWYLNSRNMQERLNYLGTKGSKLPYLSVEELGSLEIPIPPMNTQEDILKIVQLQQRERLLTQQLLEKKELYINELIKNKIKQ